MTNAYTLHDEHRITRERNGQWRVYPNDLPGDRLYLDFTRPLHTGHVTIPLLQLDENNNRRRVSTPSDMETLLWLSAKFDWPMRTSRATYKVARAS